MTIDWPVIDLSFDWPLMLFGLLLIPLLVLGYLLAQRRRRAYTMRFTNVALLGQVAGRAPAWRRHVPPALYLLGMAALLISLARPNAVVALPRDQTAVMLAIDVSGSMAATDLLPNRMAAAKQAARTFVERLPQGQQIGLVSFNSAASVNAGLTRDRTRVLRAIDALNANGGTAIGDGLNAALDQLDRRPMGLDGQRAAAMVVLLSDGASTAGQPPARAAARARAEGIKVQTVGIGERGAAPLIGGRLPARLDEQALQAIATETGGGYFYAAEAGDLAKIYSDLGAQVSLVQEKTEVTALVAVVAAAFVLVSGLLGLRWFQQLP